MKRLITSLFVLVFLSQLGFSQIYWQDQSSPTDARYYAVSQNSSDMYGSNGLASGSAERFYHRVGSGNWTQVTTNLPSGSINGLWTLNSGTLLACHSFVTSVTFYRSSDNGATWSLAYTVPVYKGTLYNVVQSSDNSVYLVNTFQVEDIRKSTDDGVSWNTVPNTTHQFKDLVTAGGTTLFGLATTTPSWVHTSTDGGTSWTMCGAAGYNVGLGFPGGVFGTPNGNLYLKNYFKSTDGGANWIAITAAPTGSGIRFTDKGNNVFVTNDPTNFFRSTDAGQTYMDVVNGLGLDPSTSMQYIVTPNDGEVYISTLGPNSVHKFYKFGIANAVQESSAISNLEIFPNPAKEFLSIYSSSGGNTIVEIFNIQGKKVMSSNISLQKNSTSTIALPKSLKGFCIIHLINEKGEYQHQKIIIE